MNSFPHLMFTHAVYLHEQLKKAKCYISKLNCQSLVSHEKQIVQRLASLYKLLAYIKKYANNIEHTLIDEKGRVNTNQTIQYNVKGRADMGLPDFQKDGNYFEDKLKQKISESEELWVQALQQIKIAIECSFINRHKFNKVAYLLVRFVEDKSKISLRHYLSTNKNEENLISRLNNIIKSNDDYDCYNRNSFSQYIRKQSNCLSVQNILKIISQSQKIPSQLLNKMLINLKQIKDDDPCMQYIPSVCTHFHKCWNCISFFYQNAQIQSHLNCKNNFSDPVFFISDQETKNILQNINSNLLEEMYYRAANLQSGVILMGLNKHRLIDRMHSANKNIESDIINNLLLRHKEEKLLYEKIYEVIGIQLQVDEATKRLELLLKSYSTNKELTQKTIQEHKIEFIPVYKLGRRQAKLQKKKFVIKISLQFKSVQNCKLIYSKLQSVGFKQFHVFGEQLGNDSIEGRNLAYNRQQVDKKTNRKVGIYQNKLYGIDIYNQILSNWLKSKSLKQKKKRLEDFIQGFLENIDVEEREQIEKNIYNRHGHGLKMQDNQSTSVSFCKIFNYPINCRKIEYKQVQQEYKKSESKQKIISSDFANGQTQQNKDYYNNYYSYNYGYYQSSYEQQQYQQQVQINSQYGLFYEESIAQEPTLYQSSVSKANELIFGEIPSLVHSHTSILILSEKGRQQGLFEKFQQSLKNMNATYKISANVYEKLSSTSSRHILVISHNNKFEVLKQRMQTAAGQSKQIKLLNVKKQMMLLSQNKGKAQLAIEQLKMKFNLMYENKFMYGFLDEKLVLKFEQKKQAVFAFIVLECLQIKCIFVNEGKIKGIQLFTT